MAGASGDPPMSCDNCGQVFMMKHWLKRHCDEDVCGKKERKVEESRKQRRMEKDCVIPAEVIPQRLERLYATMADLNCAFFAPLPTHAAPTLPGD